MFLLSCNCVLTVVKYTDMLCNVMYVKASFCVICICQGFDFWRFHTPTTINFGVFGKYSGVYYTKMPINGSPGFSSVSFLHQSRREPSGTGVCGRAIQPTVSEPGRINHWSVHSLSTTRLLRRGVAAISPAILCQYPQSHLAENTRLTMQKGSKGRK